MATQTQGGGRGTSPEERASIEQQCAFKIVAGLAIAGKIADTHPAYKRLIAWLDLKTAAALAGHPATRMGPEKAEPARVPAPGAEQEREGLPPRRHFANIGQLLTAANKELKLNRKEVLFKLKISGLSQITALDEAWMILTGKKPVN